jgi:hypothetical protein
VLLKKNGETNLHHLRHFLLITSQNAFFVQLFFMSSKHLRISAFAEGHVSRPYLAPESRGNSRAVRTCFSGAPLHTVTSCLYVTSAFSADLLFVCSRVVCLLPCIALTVQPYLCY